MSRINCSCDNAVSLRQARAEWTKGIPVRGEQCYVRAAGTAWDSNGDLAYRHSDSGDYVGAYGLCRGSQPGIATLWNDNRKNLFEIGRILVEAKGATDHGDCLKAIDAFDTIPSRSRLYSGL